MGCTIGEDKLSTTQLSTIVNVITDCFRKGGKLLIAGNGGSAADAQHIAAEFLGRYKLNRPPLPAIALASDAATLTAIGNDFGFDYVFSRPLLALAKPGDVLLTLSTSGFSRNIFQALWAARDVKGIITIAFTGNRASNSRQDDSNYWVGFEGNSSGEIQEAYMKALHWICGEVELALAKDTANA